jgi:two-component system cell cycle response regulator
VTARILIVDDVEANVRVLEARLQAEYFDVRTAFSGSDALSAVMAERVDLVLLDVMMPDMSGFDVCAAIKADPRTSQVPVIMVTALDQAEDRVRGLESGADDFLTKPVSDIALITRVKSLVRLKMVTDELALRASAIQAAGFGPAEVFGDLSGLRPRILVVDDRENSTARIRQGLSTRFDLMITADPAQAMAEANSRELDLMIISLSLGSGDGLRLCSRSGPSTAPAKRLCCWWRTLARQPA